MHNQNKVWHTESKILNFLNPRLCIDVVQKRIVDVVFRIEER